MFAKSGHGVDHVGVEEMLDRYLVTIESISGARRWYQSPTALRFAALHLSLAGVDSTVEAIQATADGLAGCFDRIDPLRAYAIPMAGLAAAQGLPPSLAARSVADLLDAFASAPKPLGRTNRARAVPLLAHSRLPGGYADAVDRLGRAHHAWNLRHRWMTTGRHYSFAAIAAAIEVDPESNAAAAEDVHDRLNDAGYWHEWDASILLSFHPDGAEVATTRYWQAVEGFTGGSRKPPPVARDDLALVALADADARDTGARLRELNQQLLQLRPRPSRQVALASAAALVLGPEITPEVWQWNVVHGFAVYAYAEALREEASD